MGPVATGRLRDGREIAAVLRGRRKRASGLLVVHLRPREDQEPSRLAVVASRRVGGAVDRNRAKRLMREAARRVAWAPGMDIVLVARAACAESSLVAVSGELMVAARSLGAVTEPGGVEVGVGTPS